MSFKEFLKSHTTQETLHESFDEKLEEIRKTASVEKFAMTKWVKIVNPSESDLDIMLDGGYNGRVLFSYIVAQIPISKSLLDVAKKSTSILRYYDADDSDVKSLSAKDFDIVKNMRDSQSEKTNEYAYIVLRNSKLKGELDYVKTLGRMKNAMRINSQQPNGKLYNIAKKYI